MTLFLALTVVVVAAAILAATAFVVWRVVRTLDEGKRETPPLPSSFHRAPMSSGQAAQDRGEAVQIILPDYVDELMLQEVAEQRGLNFQDVAIHDHQTERNAKGTGGKLQGKITAPGLAEVAGQLAGSETSESTSSRGVTSRRRMHFRAKIDAVLNELATRNELITDLNHLPSGAIPEATFLQAERALRHEWELGPPSGPDPIAEDASDEEKGQFEELVELSEALRTVSREARWLTHIAITEALQARQNEIHHHFALVPSRWHVHQTDGRLELGIAQIRTGGPLLPRTSPATETIAAPNHEIWVPLTHEHLLPQGHQRLTVDEFVVATVFGRVESFDRQREALIVLPIAIYSEEREQEYNHLGS